MTANAELQESVTPAAIPGRRDELSAAIRTALLPPERADALAAGDGGALRLVEAELEPAQSRYQWGSVGYPRRLPVPGADFPIPEHVAILGLGPSLEQYVDLAKRLGGKHALCDEVWGINAVAGVIVCDRVFHMDDVRVQEVRAKALPESNIARMLEWLRVHPGPVITSRAHPDYPGLVEFPLEDLLNKTGRAPYFNSTAAYAVAYAIYLGVRKISLFGIDYTYPDAHQAEKGRACVEYWLGIAAQLGILVSVPKTSTLLDAMHTQHERLYGYDTRDVTLHSAGGHLRVEFAERELPTAAEIEARYDHAQHPNAIVEGAKPCQ